MCALQYQPLQLNGIRPHTFVADADEGVAMPLYDCVVRGLGSSLYLDDDKPLAVLFMEREVDLRHGIHQHLDGLANELSIPLRIGKTSERTVVRHAEQQPAALGVGERADGLEPARWILALKHQLLVVRRRLTYVVLQPLFQPHFTAYCTTIPARAPPTTSSMWEDRSDLFSHMPATPESNAPAANSIAASIPVPHLTSRPPNGRHELARQYTPQSH